MGIKSMHDATTGKIYMSKHVNVCIIHQEALCGKALKIEHVMSTVTLINFKRAKGLNHGPFHSFLEETDSGHGTVPYHTEAQWPNPAKVLIYVVA